jgi:multiple sugar transport system permease protein
VLPGVLLFVLVLGFPVITTLINSFCPVWTAGVTKITLQNYTRLAQDWVPRKVLGNTLTFVCCTVLFHFLLGLTVATALDTEVRGKRLFRVLAILPWAVPDSISGLIWRFLYDPLHGTINKVLLTVHLIDTPIEWLSNPTLSLLSVIFADVWRGYPFVMLILLAGLQSIPPQLYEAAEVDGASTIQRYVRITLPQLKTMIIIALALDTIWQFRMFGLVFTLTGGGPGRQTETLPLLVYKQYFNYFNFEYAAAIAVASAAAMLVLSIPYLWIMLRRE